MIQRLIEHVVKELVRAPESVKFSQRLENGKTIVDIEVAQEDLKRVIGKEGGIIKALRGLVNALGPDGEKEVLLNSHT
jgi:uncharacterized protein